MKITTTNTALGLLEKIDPFSFTLSEDSEHSDIQYKRNFGLSIVREWPKMVDRFKSKIQYISDPFYDAFIKTKHKLTSVLDKEPIRAYGTLICRVSASETNTIFYDLKTYGSGKEFRIDIILFFFSKMTTRDIPSLGGFVHWKDGGISTQSYLSESISKNNITPTAMIGDILALVIFLKYCDLETKMIEPTSKGYHVNTKYVNDTKRRIEVLDSTWFTTIVRSQGFWVGKETGGFFRLQPCGKDLADRKLIWVEPFEKDGYTRHAKILSHGTN